MEYKTRFVTIKMPRFAHHCFCPMCINFSSFYGIFFSISQHFFEEPEGRTDLPQSLKEKVFSWRRLQDVVSDGKVMYYRALFS